MGTADEYITIAQADSRLVCRLLHSNNTTPAATLTFKDATPPVGPPAIGIETRESQCLATF